MMKPYRRRSYHRWYDIPKNPIARCAKCGQEFTWLPDGFDMRHRFNKKTHLLCGGKVEPVTLTAPAGDEK